MAKEPKGLPKMQISNSSKLGDIVEIQPGYQFRGKVQNDPDGDGYLIQLKDIIKAGEFNPDTQKKTGLTKIKLEGINNKYAVISGDLLVPSRGTHTLSVYINSKEDKTVASSNTIASGYFYIIRPRAEFLTSNFLSWFLNSKPAQLHLSKYKRGTNILALAREGLEELVIPIPELAVQQLIGELNSLAAKEEKITTQLMALKAKFLEKQIFASMSLETPAPGSTKPGSADRSAERSTELTPRSHAEASRSARKPPLALKTNAQNLKE